MGKDVEEKLLVELWQIALGGGVEEFGGQRQDAVIAGRVIASRLSQLWRHQGGVAGARDQIVEAVEQIIPAGMPGSAWLASVVSLQFTSALSFP